MLWVANPEHCLPDHLFTFLVAPIFSEVPWTPVVAAHQPRLRRP
jgi:hypothetical protein